MVGAYCEAKIIMISTNFSIFLNDQNECIVNFSFLDLDFCLECFTAFKVVS